MSLTDRFQRLWDRAQGYRSCQDGSDGACIYYGLESIANITGLDIEEVQRQWREFQPERRSAS